MCWKLLVSIVILTLDGNSFGMQITQLGFVCLFGLKIEENEKA